MSIGLRPAGERNASRGRGQRQVGVERPEVRSQAKRQFEIGAVVGRRRETIAQPKREIQDCAPGVSRPVRGQTQRATACDDDLLATLDSREQVRKPRLRFEYTNFHGTLLTSYLVR